MLTSLLKKTILSFLFSCILINAYAQSAEDLDAQIKKTVTEIKQGKKVEKLGLFKRYLKTFPKEIYIKCTPLLNDKDAQVRNFAYQLLSLTSNNSKEPGFRKSVASILLKGCKDKEIWLRKNNAKRLENYNFKEFSFASKNKVKEILHMDETYAKHIYLMAGFLQLKDQVRYLKQLLAKTTPKDGITAHNLRAALGRLGDKSQIDSLIDIAKKSMSDLRYDKLLFPLLVYTRDKKAINYTFEEFNGSNKLLSARIIDILAPVIEDFPIKVNENGETEIDDYEDAIQQVKNWHRKTGDSYTVVKGKF